MRISRHMSGFHLLFLNGWDLGVCRHIGVWYIIPKLEYTRPIKGWHAWGIRSGWLCFSVDLEKWDPSSGHYINR